MSNILKKINETTKYVCEHSKYVTINYNKIDEIIATSNFENNSYWMASNPFGLLDMSLRDIINFLLVYHTIGLCCLWGNPKWEIVTSNGDKIDGSFALLYTIIEKIKNGLNYDMTFKEFKSMLSGNVEIPLLKKRYECFTKLNKYLKNINGDFYDQIKDINEDTILLDYIITNFPYLKDVCEYQGHTIYFYKKAQLFASDILNIKKLVGNIDVDLSHLVGCADYKIPQVMRNLGMIEYNEELSNMVDNLIEIPEYSEMEIEIRAANIVVIDYIYHKLNKQVTRININDYIWLLGQDKSKMLKPYHRTKTMNY